jgi:transposase
MTAVMIGVDPAKRSNTIEVIDSNETVLVTARFENTNEDYRKMRTLVKRWPERVWAVEGATGVGLHLAQRLISDGERVVDVPSKLSTRVRAIDSGHGRKNDPTDAHAVAVVGPRTKGLREVVADDQTVALRLLSERRRDLVRSRTQAVNRLHQVLMELLPAGAQRHLTAAKAKDLVATVRPRDIAGKARRQLAVDLIDDVAVFDRKIKTVDARIEEAVAASGTHLTDIVGVGPVTAATILGEVGDVARFATADNFASYTGTAPIEASSGDVVRHRLSRAGNRRLNSALHVVALSNKRYDPRGKAYYERKLAAGKGSKGSLRCLKRRLSDVVFRVLVEERAAANPGGQMGATLTASAVDQIPKANTSDKPQPGSSTQATPTKRLAEAAS